jgi:CheY-like chemotaxis protein
MILIKSLEIWRIRLVDILQLSPTTAYAIVGDRVKCIEAGMDDYIEKPINAEKFYFIVEKYLTSE